jgi:hypothetical protein
MTFRFEIVFPKNSVNMKGFASSVKRGRRRRKEEEEKSSDKFRCSLWDSALVSSRMPTKKREGEKTI